MSGFTSQLSFKRAWDPDYLRRGPVGEKIHQRLGISTNPAPAPEVIGPVIEDTDARRQDEADRIRRRNGRASAMLSGGNAGVPVTQGRTLLGA